MSPRRHRIAQRALAVVVGALVAVFGLELYYRVARLPGLGPTTNPAYVQHDAMLGWAYRPGTKVRHTTSEFDVEIEINTQGFRGREWGPKSPGRPRILVLGDSFAFGWGVDEAQSFTSRLQAAVPEWEILNAAVSGYGTDQEYVLLQRLLPSVKPDLVIAVFSANDVVESSSDTSYGKRKPYFVRRGGALELAGVPIPDRPWIERTSYLCRAISKDLVERAATRRRPDFNEAWVRVCDLYRAMQHALGEVPLVIVSSEERLARFGAEEKSIHHIDLRPALQSVSGTVTYPIDGHWTALSHAAIADELARSLRSLLP